MQRPYDLNDMYFFAQIVEHQGYAAAARALGIQTSRLSRRVSMLEQQLGVRLLNRTTRSVSLTESGKTFYRHCLAVVAAADMAQQEIDQSMSTPRGLVRISCPLGLLQSNVTAILTQYLIDFPQVRIALEATNRRVAVVEEGFDIVIRVRNPPLDDSDLVARVLGSSPMILVGNAALWRSSQRPQSAADVAQLPTLSMVMSAENYVWHLVDGNATPVDITHQPRLVTDDMATLRSAAIAAIGIALLPANSVQADIENGELERILPALSSTHGLIHAIYPSRRGLVPSIRSLLDALDAGFREGSSPSGSAAMR